MCAKSSKTTKQKTSISLDPEVLAWLKREAERLDRSMSWIINDWLKRKARESNG